MVRLPIREQLATLILLASLIGLSVISIATWVTVHDFVLRLRTQRLGFTASLKASQLAANLAIMQHSAQCISSRIIIGQTLQKYNAIGANTPADWVEADADLQAAIDSSAPNGGRLSLQSMVYAVNDTGPGGSYGLLNVTLTEIEHQIKLPFENADGSSVFFGDPGLGYPPWLYPNLTYSHALTSDGSQTPIAFYNGAELSADGDPLILGPYMINSTFSLLSLTVPIDSTSQLSNVIGWMTVVFDASIVTNVTDSRTALDPTAAALLVGPANSTNKFGPGVLYNSPHQSEAAISAQLVHYVFPLMANLSDRHPNRITGTANPPFPMDSYDAIRQVFTVNHDAINNAGGSVYSSNEASYKISTGYALVDFPAIDWAIVVEEARSQVWVPITSLRHVLVICICATIAALVVVIWPLAHFVSSPIRQLREATMKSVMPPGSSEQQSDSEGDALDDSNHAGMSNGDLARKEGFLGVITAWRRKDKRSSSDRKEDARRRQFRIPGKVSERKHFVKDELTDLTSVYNEMSDELMMQYEKLEERVRQRTAELELSKKAAEAANESKTLFIANISHELKTPLNGILGMCAVCMQEDDPVRLKRSLGIIYKSGDLLLNLLTDLLTFSKNQVGQQLSLDEKEFRLRDISSQILAIFDKQAKEGSIDLQFMYSDEIYSDGAAEVPFTGGRLKDMMLWGDTHRILQVIINLVSNSLKFTPAGGNVTVTVRYLGDAPDKQSTRHPSISSMRQSSRKRNSDNSFMSGKPVAETPKSKGNGDKRTSVIRVSEVERALPPPGRNSMFEFEVTDSGPGIPENLHQRIFEPFVQGDLGLTKKYGGTGLGLSICSQLAGLMKGSMGIQSEVGKGSRFSMKIPLRHLNTRADSNASSSVDLRQQNVEHSAGIDPLDSTANSQPPGLVEDRPRLIGLSHPFFASNEPMESPGSQSGAMEQITATASKSGKIRVLVAEDNTVNQEVVTRMLKLEDIYDVTVAKDGQEALDLVKESMKSTRNGTGKGPFNLIFMDVQMPNLDGLQSTRLIRESGYQAPIVALTAFAEESNVKDCLDSGMNHFLSKPIKRPALAKVLRQYCTPIPEIDENAASLSMSAKPNGGHLGHKESAASLAPPRTSSEAGPRDRSAPDRRPSIVDIANAQPNATVVVISRPGSMDGA